MKEKYIFSVDQYEFFEFVKSQGQEGLRLVYDYAKEDNDDSKGKLFLKTSYSAGSEEVVATCDTLKELSDYFARLSSITE